MTTAERIAWDAERVSLRAQGTKRCCACKEVKARTDFGASTNADGRQGRCRACCAAIVARQRSEDPSKHKASKKRSYAKHRDRLLAETRAWRAANKDHVRKRKKEWDARNPDKLQVMYLRKRAKGFGLTAEQYLAMHAAQGGACAICGRDESQLSRRLSIDHEHDTGRVRALLCGACNTMIGQARESIEVLERAIGYLAAHGRVRKVA